MVPRRQRNAYETIQSKHEPLVSPSKLTGRACPVWQDAWCVLDKECSVAAADSVVVPDQTSPVHPWGLRHMVHPDIRNLNPLNTRLQKAMFTLANVETLVLIV
jgi:hypothetical protein